MILNKKFLESILADRSDPFRDTPTVTAVGGAIHSKRVRVLMSVRSILFPAVVAAVPEG